jgi:hypothetical protein
MKGIDMTWFEAFWQMTLYFAIGGAVLVAWVAWFVMWCKIANGDIWGFFAAMSPLVVYGFYAGVVLIHTAAAL